MISEFVREDFVSSSQFESRCLPGRAWRAEVVEVVANLEKDEDVVLGVSALTTLNCASDWDRPMLVAARMKMWRR